MVILGIGGRRVALQIHTTMSNQEEQEAGKEEQKETKTSGVGSPKRVSFHESTKQEDGQGTTKPKPGQHLTVTQRRQKRSTAGKVSYNQKNPIPILDSDEEEAVEDDEFEESDSEDDFQAQDDSDEDDYNLDDADSEDSEPVVAIINCHVNFHCRMSLRRMRMRIPQRRRKRNKRRTRRKRRSPNRRKKQQNQRKNPQQRKNQQSQKSQRRKPHLLRRNPKEKVKKRRKMKVQMKRRRRSLHQRKML